MYDRARELIELSCNKMLPGQVEQEANLHLWQLIWQASTASNGVAIREFGCPLRHYCNCWVGLHIVKCPDLLQLERLVG